MKTPARSLFLLLPGMFLAWQLHAAEPAMDAPAPMSPAIEVHKEMAGGQQEKKCPMHEGMAKHHESMAKDLQLNEQQRKAFDEAEAKMMGMMEGGMQFHRELRDYIDSDGFSEQGLRDKIHQHSAALEQKQVEASMAMRAFRQSLSSEQKEKLKALREQHKNGWHEHMHSTKNKVKQEK